MGKKTRNILFHLSENARITTKSLGKECQMSQQLASYSIKQLLRRGQIERFTTVVDSAKFGFNNVLVLYNYVNFNKKKIEHAKKILVQDPHVTRVDELAHGADLLVQYTTPNLSFFNKLHGEILEALHSELFLTEIFVVIVRRLDGKKYLSKKKTKGCILSGDRDPIQLSNTRKRVLTELKKSPRAKITELAEKLQTDVRTVLNAKKYLEQNKIIRKYSVELNYPLLEIRRTSIFIKLESAKNEIFSFMEFTKKHPNITEVVKLIGQYNLVITIEKFPEDKSIINELRKEFRIAAYRILDCERNLKNTYIPDTL